MEDVQRLVDIPDEHAFGDFKFEAARRKPALCQGLRDARDEAVGRELTGRDVDCNADVFRPLRRLTAGLAQGPLAELHDQAGFLGNRDERCRAYHSVLLVRPAHESLEALDAVLRHGKQGLEVKLEITIPDRAAHIDFQMTTTTCLGVEFGFEEVVAALAIVLGTIEREIGAFEEGVRAVRVLRADRDADTGGNNDAASVDGQFAVERGFKSAGQGSAVGCRLESIEQEAEIVTAEPRHHGVRVAVLKRLRHGAQQLVSKRVTQCVVYGLEVVNIDEGYERALAFALSGYGSFQLFDEETAIGQAGQCIVERCVHDLLFALFYRIDHRVEAGGERAQLDCAFDLDLCYGTAGIGARCFREQLQWPGNPAREADRGPCTSQQSEQPDQHEHQAKTEVTR
ncbi:hypothetical protein NJ75_04643 [Novosphingobium subterraneum]|uniref:Uncharacterized protein n=1 Tax=Novosphingobium subterraneum TaxID=48936 RepID=A0A0B8Z5X0_9SPHN|nr:hypothetical protein NJ75_04643 [Novosphingobium subterraneum]